MIYNELLEYYVGKACTINTTQVNFRFKEEQMMAYFVGIVELINQQGMSLLHPVNHTKSFVAMEHIVSITEEQVIYPTTPEAEQLITDYEKEKPITAARTKIESMPMPPMTDMDSIFVNPKAMAELAKKAKEKFKKT